MWQDILKIWARYSGVYWEGLLGTLWIAALTVLLGTVLGTLLAVLRLSRSRVGQGLAGFYIWIIRGTPVLLQLYFFYLLLPKVLPVQIGETESVMTALVINASAYVSEIIRAGIQAVDAGQAEAASCLGLNRRQTLRFIILPTYLSIESLLISGLIYLLVTTVFTQIVNLAEHRMAVSN